MATRKRHTLTAFGRIVRKYRIDAGVTASDMAEKLGVSLSYLSAVEFGKKKLTQSFTEKVIDYFKVWEELDINAIVLAADLSQDEIRIDVTQKADEEKVLIASFLRTVETLPDKQKQRVRELLEKYDPKVSAGGLRQ